MMGMLLDDASRQFHLDTGTAIDVTVRDRDTMP
jgi:hypothetical protein